MHRSRILLILLALTACDRAEPEQAIPDHAENSSPGFGPEVSTSGCTRLEASNEALLFASGRILSVLVSEGDTVAANQTLVVLSGDRTMQTTASATSRAVEAATLALGNAEAEYGRCLELYEAGAISLQALEGAEAVLRSAEAAGSEARAADAGARAGAVATRVEAPFDGVVGRVWARVGDSAGSEPVLMITGGSGYRALLLLPEREMGRIGTGDRAVFATSALPGMVFEGIVVAVAAALDPVTCLLPVTVRFEDPEGLMAPGLYGTVTVFPGPVPQGER